MKKQDFFWPDNLKKLRDRKKLTQEQLAEKLNMRRSTLNALESGQTKNPSLEIIVKIADFFKISVDTFLKTDLNRISELQIHDLEAGNDAYLTGRNLRILATTLDKTNSENIEIVPIKAKAGYASGFNDPEYISSLPKFQMPILPKNKTYRMFPITGDSMLPYTEGSYIIAEYIEDWLSLKKDTLCIVILSDHGNIVFKSVKHVRDSSYVLQSYNPRYKPLEIEAGDILEIWKYNSYWTKDTLSPRSSLEEMAEKIELIHAKLI